MKFIFFIIVTLFAVGCGQSQPPQSSNKHSSPAANLTNNHDDGGITVTVDKDGISILKGACIKVENVRQNAFDNKPEYIATWFLKEDGTLMIMVTAPSSPNWDMMRQIQAYRRYEIKAKIARAGERSKIISVEDGGEWVIK